MYCQQTRCLLAASLIKSNYLRCTVLLRKKTFQKSLKAPFHHSGFHIRPPRAAEKATISSRKGNDLEVEPQVVVPAHPLDISKSTITNRKPTYAPNRSLMGLTGGQIVCEMLRRQNVDCIFGYPGGAILPVFDALYKDPNFRFIFPRHEQGAGHMAEGYARASRKPGVVLVTSGPGVTNLITPSQDALKDAKKPVIYAGNGVLSSAEGAKSLAQLAEAACIPVATTLLGMGCFDEEDPKSLRMLGMHGTAYANKAIQEADLVIALGARFDDRVTGDIDRFAPVARAAGKEKLGGIIHFEIHSPHINKIIECDAVVQGDVTAGLTELFPHVRKIKDRPEWMGQIANWKKKYPMKPAASLCATRISPEAVISRLSDLTKQAQNRIIVTTGVGSHQMWATQFFRWAGNRSLITSGGAGTMGFGLPAAIGAKLAQPDAMVIDIDGDASLSMSLTEMSVAAEYGINIKILVLNNEEQGMVTQWQALDYDKRYSHSHQQNPDFVKVANGMGIDAQRLDAVSDISDKLQWLVDSEGPALLEVKVEDKVPVLPWVAPGKALDEIIMTRDQIWASKK